MRRPHLEILAALLSLGTFVVLLIQTFDYPASSALMPQAIVSAAIFLTLIWIAQKILHMVRVEYPVIRVVPAAVWRYVALVGGAGLVVLGISTIGFFSSATVMLPLIAVAIGYRKPVPLLIGTVAFVAILFAVFHLLLKIPLPQEAIFSVLG